MMMDRRPNILVFDSGIGGISVYNEIRQKIPKANYTYLFDNQAFPYGDKSTDYLIERVVTIVEKAIAKYPIDIVVIACNTASTICLPKLRESLSIPVVGVVPAIKPATKVTRNNCIGILATKATIQREYTRNLITEFAKGYDVKLLGLSELALIAEEKLQGIPVNIQQLIELMSPWLSLDIVPDTIVLGCTHYPFIKDELNLIFPNSAFIDSGYAIATRVYNLLEPKFILDNQNTNEQGDNLLCSTLYNNQVEKLLVGIRKYDLIKYQLLK